MASRIYRSPIIGDGKTSRTAFRPALADLKARGLSMQHKVVTNAAGRAVGTDALVLVEGNDFSSIDTRVHALVQDLGVVPRAAAVVALETHYQGDLAKHRAVGLVV